MNSHNDAIVNFLSSGFIPKTPAEQLAADLPNMSSEQIQAILASRSDLASIGAKPVETVKAQPISALSAAGADASASEPLYKPTQLNPTLVRPTTISHFEMIATPLIGRGWKVCPTYPWDAVDADGEMLGKTVHGKLCPSPLAMQSSDPAQIHRWGLASPNSNVVVYAEQVEGGLCFVDKDGAISLVEKCERETGRKFPETLLVRSSVVDDGKGGTITKGHWYFRQSPKTMALKKNITELMTGGLLSFRIHNQYVASIGSTHPMTKQPYVAMNQLDPIVIPDWFVDWLLTLVVVDDKKKPATTPTGEGALIEHGQIHPWMMREGGKLRNQGLDYEVLEPALQFLVAKNCAPPINTSKVTAAAKWLCDQPAGQTEMMLSQTPPINGVLEMTGEKLSHDTIDDEFSQSSIPPFDPSVIKGFYKEAVDELTKGTTLQPQFMYSIIKAIVGAKMAGHVKFDDLDVQPLIQLALCADSSGGKGEAWRRSLMLLKAPLENGAQYDNKNNLVTCNAKVKVLEGVDSGAGLKDAFFDAPEDQPITLYIDETASLGHKASEKKSPEIIDAIGELADSTTVTRVKAQKSAKQKSAKTKNDAYLVMIMCGQTSDVFTSAFAGRKNLGWRVRLTPEHGTKQEVGDLPPVPEGVLTRLLKKLNGLPYSGTMSTSADAKACLERYWASLPSEIRTEPRYKKQIKLDAYRMAFGRSSKVVELSDMEDSVKIFTRQLAIRRVYFRGEVPDRVGFYEGGITELIDWMRRKLAEGVPEARVARAKTDFMEKTNASRDLPVPGVPTKGAIRQCQTEQSTQPNAGRVI